ncbi:MAG: DNA mismatch repair protein MutS [Actinomycetota bacterium]|nr:DNA mismatch repair protein MutS [Actinomycetota bacterium]
MKAHLLFRDADFDFEMPTPDHEDDVLQDLDLTTVLDAMSEGDSFLELVARRVLLTSLTDGDAIRYRQRVLADCLRHPDLVRELYALAVDAMTREKRIYQPLFSHASGVLRQASERMGLFVEILRRLRALADAHQEEVTSEGLVDLFEMLRTELSDDYFREIEDHLHRLGTQNGVLVSAGLGVANRAIQYVLRRPSGARRSLRERMGIGVRNAFSFEIAPRDEAGARALADLTDRGVNLAANALAQSAEHVHHFFLMLCQELAFYVACCNLHDRLEEVAASTCTPDPELNRENALAFSNLRDVGLVLRTRAPVVGNDLKGDGASLVMVTGANSGGKSTFLRSLGQAQVMAQCGLFVCAETFASSLCDRVLTHFTREEDSTMTSGKLDEELARMSDLADTATPASMVLFNESFAATNEREGSEIARQVVRALREAGVRVGFVTHMYDLARSLYQEGDDTTRFLRAERGPDGARQYKLVEGPPLSTSYGVDLFERMGGWSGSRQPSGREGRGASCTEVPTTSSDEPPAGSAGTRRPE